jgi:peptidyl-prolyl cis-trans isomerase D
MLQSMRERMQGIIMTVIVAIVCVAFAIWGIQYYLRSGRDEQAAAKVNRHKITMREVNLEYERAKRRMISHTGKYPVLDQVAILNLKKQIVSDLIKTYLLNNEIKNLGLNISDEAVMEFAKTLPQFQVNGVFSPERFGETLSQLQFTQRNFIDEVAAQTALNQLTFGIRQSAFLMPDEFNWLATLINQKRDARFAMVAPSSFVQEVIISLEEIKKYYDDHPNQFMLPEKVSIEYVQLSADELAKKIDLSTEKLKDFYQERIESFSLPTKWKVEWIFLPINNEDDQAILTKTRNQIEQINNLIKQGKNLTEASGGIAKTVLLNQRKIAVDFAVELNKLKVGETSGIIKTKDGYQILKLLEKEPGKVLPFSQVMDEVRKAYLHREMVELFSSTSDKLSDLTYTNSNTLKPAADNLGLKINSTGIFTKEGGEGIAKDSRVIKAAFSSQVLNDGYNSNLIDLGEAHVMVLRVKDHIPQTRMPFTDAAKIIEKDLKTLRLETRAKEEAANLFKKLEQGISISSEQKRYRCEWVNLNQVDRFVKNVDPLILKEIFRLHLVPGKKSVFSLIDLGEKGAALIAVDKIYPGAAGNLSLTKDRALKKETEEKIGGYDYFLWFDNLQRRAKIKFEPLGGEENLAN